MSFYPRDEEGNPIRRQVGCDCTGDKIRTEQAHKEQQDINNIVHRHGIDLITKVALLKSAEYQFDDMFGNDFQEAMEITTKAQQTFDNLPSAIRKQFDNSPAMFLDYVQNPDNQESLVEMGLANPPTSPPPPMEVIVKNQETPPAEIPPAYA